MKRRRKCTMARLIRVLNRDIVREFLMADLWLREADRLTPEFHPVLRRQAGLCAAAAMANATALAAEVVSLGGVPVTPEAPLSLPVEHGTPVAHRVQRTGAMLAHYRKRLRMAERMGLLRLKEVFQQIVNSKEWHQAHTGLFQTGDAAKYLCS
jgi:hypothetical protein